MSSESIEPREVSYVQLEALAVLYDIFHAERSILYPENDFIFLTFSQNFGANIYLDRMELELDGEQVEVKRYDGGDILLLMDGAVQEVYAALILPGQHVLKARLFGLGLVNKSYIEGTTEFIKGPGTLYLRVKIEGGALEFTNWN